MSNSLKIGVVFGGPSSEHDVSLATGKNVVTALQSLGHDVTGVYVAQSGNWFLGTERGVAYDPQSVCGRFDVMFNALHGEYGEDGKIQQIFEQNRVSYTGSGIAASAFAMNKVIAREIFKNAGLTVPRAVVVRKDEFNVQHLKDTHQMSAPPWVVKPASRGSSVGVSIVMAFEELAKALEHAFTFDTLALVEEYINGREMTCGVLENFDNKRYHVLHPVEIIPPEGRFFDYEVKYNGATKEIPAPFFGEMLRRVQQTAVAAHTALGCRHYSRTDMIIKGTKIYVLETNTLPGLTSESLFPKAASWAKLEFPQLCEHLVRLAINA